MDRRWARRERRAFTLIELLVVVAIIMVLAAMLMPALSKARDMSRATACANNQKNLGIAFHLYADDSGDYFPPVDGEAGYGGAWPTVTGMYNLLPPYIGYPKGISAAQYPLSIFNCPAYVVRFPVAWRGPYAMSLCLNEPYTTFASHAFTRPPNVPQISAPETKILMSECANDWHLGEKSAVPDYSSPQFDLWRHLTNSANVLFVEGHVQRYSAKVVVGNLTTDFRLR